MSPNYETADGLMANTRSFGQTAVFYVQERASRIIAAAAILLIGYLIAKAAVLGTANGLRLMGLADDIINLAYGPILGAIAVAFAFALGFGGRDATRAAMEKLGGPLAMAPSSIAPQSSTTLQMDASVTPQQESGR